MDSSPCLEDLLTPLSPSGAERREAAVAKSGVADAEIAATKSALAALAQGSVASEPPPSGVKARILASASRARASKYGVFADRIARLFDMTVEAADELMQKIERSEGWMPFLVEGLEMMPVPAGPKCAGAIATMVKIAPGTKFPEHAHRGNETMFVIDGGFVEPAAERAARGVEVWRGDERYSPDGSEHALVGLPGVPCIAATLIEGHADFVG